MRLRLVVVVFCLLTVLANLLLANTNGNVYEKTLAKGSDVNDWAACSTLVWKAWGRKPPVKWS